MSEIHLRETPQQETPRRKRIPKKTELPLPFSYSPSDDGTDENLLILLHGLGDSQIPFFKLGCSFKLPQTAVLSLRAPEQIPYLYEQAFQWYESFDLLGELIQNPNPTPALDVLTKVIQALTNDFNWPPHRLHFFGFAQGGSVAAELAIRWWRSSSPKSPFGSLVSISGPLLSYPTLDNLSSTPVLLVHRKPLGEPSMPKNALAAFKKAFTSVQDVVLDSPKSGMPASRAEWEPIMRFWSSRLGKRQVDGLYEVLSGVSPAS